MMMERRTKERHVLQSSQVDEVVANAPLLPKHDVPKVQQAVRTLAERLPDHTQQISAGVSWRVATNRLSAAPSRAEELLPKAAFTKDVEGLDLAVASIAEALATMELEFPQDDTEASFRKRIAESFADAHCGKLSFLTAHMLEREDSQAAAFTWRFDRDFTSIPEGTAARETFKTQFQTEVARALGVRRTCVEITKLSRGSIIVDFRIKQDLDGRSVDTLASALAAKIKAKDSSLFSGEILRTLANNSSAAEYTFVPVFDSFSLGPSEFCPEYNYDYRPGGNSIPRNERRGDQPYYAPEGYYRFALAVLGKFDGGNDAWIGNRNPGDGSEWAVAYHGVGAGKLPSGKALRAHQASKSILGTGLRPGTRDVKYSEAATQNPKAAGTRCKAVYTTPNIATADRYAPQVEVQTQGGPKAYKFVFMCRVDTKRLTKHGDYWRVWDETAVRPYGLLLKAV